MGSSLWTSPTRPRNGGSKRDPCPPRTTHAGLECEHTHELLGNPHTILSKQRRLLLRRGCRVLRMNCRLFPHSDDMQECHYGMPAGHSGACVPHHGEHPVAHGRFVTMDCAARAHGLVFAPRASGYFLVRVFHKRPAIGADILPVMMILMAIQFYHDADSLTVLRLDRQPSEHDVTFLGGPLSPRRAGVSFSLPGPRKTPRCPRLSACPQSPPRCRAKRYGL